MELNLFLQSAKVENSHDSGSSDGPDGLKVLVPAVPLIIQPGMQSSVGDFSGNQQGSAYLVCRKGKYS
jgi:hypothetical protein